MTQSTIFWKLVHRTDFEPDPSGWLCSRESEKLASFRFAKRRQEWLLGRQAAKSLVKGLPGFMDAASDEMEVVNLPEGAPRLRLRGEEAALRLSISHREEVALCGAILDKEVGLGVDLERIEPRSQEFQQDYLTQAECELVGSYPVEQRDAAAALIWSAKEAMLKALEVGLRWDTRRVEIIHIEGDLLGRESQPAWQALTVRCPAAGQRQWQAWWQRRGEYLLTVAALHSGLPAERAFVLAEI